MIDGGTCLVTTTNTNRCLQIPAASAGDSPSGLSSVPFQCCRFMSDFHKTRANVEIVNVKWSIRLMVFRDRIINIRNDPEICSSSKICSVWSRNQICSEAWSHCFTIKALQRPDITRLLLWSSSFPNILYMVTDILGSFGAFTREVRSGPDDWMMPYFEEWKHVFPTFI